MKKQNLTLIALLLILAGLFASCKPESKSEETHTPNISVCGVEDPLTDLPWLKDIITELESYVNQGYPVSYRIYQCTYKDGIGFLLDNLELIYDKAIPLINCEGKLLCELYGFNGNPCTEFEIDLENKVLIWELIPKL